MTERALCAVSLGEHCDSERKPDMLRLCKKRDKRKQGTNPRDKIQQPHKNHRRFPASLVLLAWWLVLGPGVRSSLVSNPACFGVPIQCPDVKKKWMLFAAQYQFSTRIRMSLFLTVSRYHLFVTHVVLSNCPAMTRSCSSMS